MRASGRSNEQASLGLRTNSFHSMSPHLLCELERSPCGSSTSRALLGDKQGSVASRTARFTLLWIGGFLLFQFDLQRVVFTCITAAVTHLKHTTQSQWQSPPSRDSRVKQMLRTACAVKRRDKNHKLSRGYNRYDHQIKTRWTYVHKYIYMQTNRTRRRPWVYQSYLQRLDRLSDGDGDPLARRGRVASVHRHPCYLRRPGEVRDLALCGVGHDRVGDHPLFHVGTWGTQPGVRGVARRRNVLRVAG